MARYTVDVLTPTGLERHPDFPENSYDAETVEEVASILHNCTRTIAGLSFDGLKWRIDFHRPEIGKLMIERLVENLK